MPYATQQDIEDVYGVDLLTRVADYNGDRIADTAVVNSNLIAADQVCNAYLSARYTIPIVPPPGVIKTCAIDIAIYKMAMGRGQRTDEMRVRYEDALRMLELIAAGKVGLGEEPPDGDGDGEPDPTTGVGMGGFLNLGRF
jgi:phage gp36-like protein